MNVEEQTVWLFNKNGQVLVQKRAAIKESWPNMWDISSAGTSSSPLSLSSLTFQVTFLLVMIVSSLHREN